MPVVQLVLHKLTLQTLALETGDGSELSGVLVNAGLSWLLLRRFPGSRLSLFAASTPVRAQTRSTAIGLLLLKSSCTKVDDLLAPLQGVWLP